MSDLSILSSGKLVHSDDRCLTTLGSLAHMLYEVLARAARGTRLRGTNITNGQPTLGDRSVQIWLYSCLLISSIYKSVLIKCSYIAALVLLFYTSDRWLFLGLSGFFESFIGFFFLFLN